MPVNQGVYHPNFEFSESGHLIASMEVKAWASDHLSTMEVKKGDLLGKVTMLSDKLEALGVNSLQAGGENFDLSETARAVETLKMILDAETGGVLADVDRVDIDSVVTCLGGCRGKIGRYPYRLPLGLRVSRA